MPLSPRNMSLSCLVDARGTANGSGHASRKRGRLVKSGQARPLRRVHRFEIGDLPWTLPGRRGPLSLLSRRFWRHGRPSVPMVDAARIVDMSLDLKIKELNSFAHAEHVTHPAH